MNHYTHPISNSPAGFHATQGFLAEFASAATARGDNALAEDGFLSDETMLPLVSAGPYAQPSFDGEAEPAHIDGRADVSALPEAVRRR